jgi:hypothetical protein
MKGSLLHIMKRIAAVTVSAAAAAAGLALAGAVPASAATNPSSFLFGSGTSHSGCDVTLFSARLSASTPAEVFASVDSTHPGHTCTGFVERSVTSTTKWAVASAKVALPSVAGLEGIANTGLVYDGPGYKARACVQAAGSAAVYCTSALSLARGAGTATSPALSPSYVRKQVQVGRFPSNGGTPGLCAGLMASSTTTKKAGATVLGLLISATDPCTAWIQSTANGGKTWTTVSPVVSYRGPAFPNAVGAFTAHYADGPGHLARLCVKDMTSKKMSCSGSW